MLFLKKRAGNSVVVQWLRIHASTAGGTGSIPGWGTKISHATHSAAKNKNNKIKMKCLANSMRYLLKGILQFGLSHKPLFGTYLALPSLVPSIPLPTHRQRLWEQWL